jgi:hypothetical protein
MPDWLPSAVIAGVAIAVLLWLIHLVVPGDWRLLLLNLLGLQIQTTAPRRTVTGRRPLTTWIMVVLAVLAVLWVLYYVFSQT